eukprot:gene19048-22775_t
MRDSNESECKTVQTLLSRIYDLEQEDQLDLIDPTMIHPNSKGKAYWDNLIIVVLLYTAYVVPYRLSFTPETRELSWEIVELVIDVLFAFDVAVNFRTCIMEDGRLIMEPIVVAKKYVKGWFAVDLIASIPWNLVIGTSANTTFSLTKVAALAKLGRLLRMLRMLRMVKFLTKLAQQERQMTHPSMTRLLKFVFFITAIVHWFACLAHTVVSNTTGEDPSLFFQVAGYESHGEFVQYIICVYWVTVCMMGHKATPQ